MPAGLAIHRLSARTPAGAQPVSARLALQALGADLEDALPRGLPPQALLWLRRLQLQAPEAALLRPAPAAWRQDWIAAGRERLDAALAQAARPAQGPVPASAAAVLFADAAEMLACLALAAQAGELDRWWWRGLLGRTWPRWQTAWVARPEAQRGARRLLARLGQGGAAEGVISRRLWAELDRLSGAPVAAQEAGDAASAGGEPAGLIAPAAAPSARPRAPEPVVAMARPIEGVARSAMSSRASGPTPIIEPAARPHTPSMPVDAPATAAPPHAAPGAAMPAPLSAEPVPLARARRLEPPASARTTGRDDAAAPARQAPEPARRRGRTVQSAPPAAPPRPLPSELEPAPSPAASGATPPLDRGTADAPAPQPVANAPPLPRGEPQSLAVPAVHTRAHAAPALAASRPATPVDEAPLAWPWPEALPSRQAPLLFVVNALLEDGLYPDFTRPLDPGLPVPLCVLLAGLARCWRLPADDGLQAALLARCPDWTPPEAMPAAPGAVAAPWPDWLATYARSLRRRLCRRLGLRAAAWPAALTLARPARLWLSEAEWVAEFELETHDVAWRLAGLDRDPGWLPSAGMTLRFRFD